MTLRERLIEAMARAWVAYEGDEWGDLGNRGMAAVKACVERELDAAIDTLTEHRVDWIEETYPGMSPDASWMRAGIASNLVAVLRWPE